MKMRIVFALMVLAVCLACASPVLADGIIIPIPHPPVDPAPPLRSLAIKYHHVSVRIEGQVAIVHVDQVFVNESNMEIEGQYIFPLPEEAAISEFAMWVDGQRIEAQVLDREEARRIYEDIVRTRRDPALLEYVGRNAFQASIYPIAARGEKRVELEYTQVLPMDAGLVRFTYPLNTEKFSLEPLEEVQVAVRIESAQPLLTVYSPSHPMDIHKTGDHLAEATYSDEQVIPDRDLVLYYSLGDEAVGANVLSYREGDEDGFFVMLMAPQTQVEAGQVVAKDVFVVLDTSGSMRGEKLEQAKGATRYVLDNLNADDRFNIISFSSGTRTFARSLQPISQVQKARGFVSELQAVGGTNIHRAFEETLAQSAGTRPQVVLFLTDGLATEGVTATDKIIARVAEMAGDNVRIFAFGVGYDVNTLLLDTISQAHHGTSVYVRPEENIEHSVSSLYEKISSAVLADVAIDWGAAHVEDVYPYPFPDIFAGSQVVLVGRYRDAATTAVTLSGTVNGALERYRYDGVVFRDQGGPDFIPRLWATRKIGYLLTQVRLVGPSEELIDEIIALSVRYGIVTPYTSFLVDETEDALSTEGRKLLSQDMMGELPGSGLGGGTMAERDALAFGAAAVENSIAQDALRQADVAAAPQAEQVRAVGNKTFVLRDGVWTDTTYEVGTSVQRIAFGSERYFQLAERYPVWGPYLALGQEVILVWEGLAYQIGPLGEQDALPERETLPTPTVSPTPVDRARVDTGSWQQIWEWWQGLR
ncbi:MAG: VIT domain-containing protein [Anaerolineae bacterium]